MKAKDYNGLKLMADVSRSLKRDTSGLTKRTSKFVFKKVGPMFLVIAKL